MIGNDIVDLNFAPRQKSQDKRFLEKIFTSTEQTLIIAAQWPEKMLWLQWSMKESAYKLSVQNGNRSRFKPLDFVTELCDNHKGRVRYHQHIYHTNSLLANQYMLTEATLKTTDEEVRAPYFYDETNYQSQHVALHNCLKKELSVSYGIAENFIEIKKNLQFVPQIYFYKKLQSIGLSLSHHGNYAAFALMD